MYLCFMIVSNLFYCTDLLKNSIWLMLVPWINKMNEWITAQQLAYYCVSRSVWFLLLLLRWNASSNLRRCISGNIRAPLLLLTTEELDWLAWAAEPESNNTRPTCRFNLFIWCLGLVGAILIVYIPIRQCARDLICDLMIRDFLVHRILQVPSHYPASPRILLLSRNTSGSSKIRGDAGDKMRGNTRCPVETRSLFNDVPLRTKCVLSP